MRLACSGLIPVELWLVVRDLLPVWCRGLGTGELGPGIGGVSGIPILGGPELPIMETNSKMCINKGRKTYRKGNNET